MPQRKAGSSLWQSSGLFPHWTLRLRAPPDALLFVWGGKTKMYQRDCCRYTLSEAVISIHYRLKRAKILALKALSSLRQLQLHDSTCACKAGILKFFDKFILVAALVFSSDIRLGYISSLPLHHLSLAFSLDLWLAGALAVCVWPHNLKRQTSISCWQKNLFCCPN